MTMTPVPNKKLPFPSMARALNSTKETGHDPCEYRKYGELGDRSRGHIGIPGYVVRHGATAMQFHYPSSSIRGGDTHE